MEPGDELLMKMLEKLDVNKLRIMMYRHECTGSKMRCCDAYRCETCHIEHLNAAHSKVGIGRAANFSSSKNIVQEARRIDIPNPKKAAAPKKQRSVKEVYYSLSEQERQEVRELIKKEFFMSE
jgi:hypothetical protein